MKRSATFVTALLIVCAAVVALPGQQAAPAPPAAPATPAQDAPPVTFRVEVNYVEVDAVVTDAQGNLVDNLTQDDFEVLEDGRRQSISAFSLVNIPVDRLVRPLFATQPVEPDVQTNTGNEGRLYLIVLDSLHTSPLNTVRVKAAARKFVEENLAANDLAAVVFTRGTSDASQDFTSNKRLLLMAIDRFIGLKPLGPTAAAMQMGSARIGAAPGDPMGDPFEFERAFNTRAAMERIRTMSEFMAGVRGRRKAMLLFGEGIEYNFNDILASTPATGVLETVRDAIGVATRANVAIYAIDPRGLTNPDQDLVFANNNPSADARSGDLGPRSAGREFFFSQNSLRQIAYDTGGFPVLNQNDFSTAFDRIVRENSGYYVLGYYSTNERRDGRFRSITVRVRRPGLQVRSRRGYVAPRGRAPETTIRPGTSPTLAAAFEAMASPIAVRGIPMRVFAAPIKGAAPNAVVALAIEFDINGLRFEETNGTFNNRLEVAVTAVDALGKQHGGTNHSVNIAMRPETLERARQNGLRVLTSIDVPPGRYQFRVAAGESTGGKAASVITDVEVPDFYKEPLVMSGLAVTSASSLDVVTVSPKDPMATFLPAPLSATREFASGDTLSLFAEFYENLPANTPAHTIDVTTTVRADDGRVLSQDEEEIDSQELVRGRGGFGFTTSVPLTLEPGLYVVQVQARSRLARPEDAVRREVLIRVR
jgi:VWFA-related protein